MRKFQTFLLFAVLLMTAPAARAQVVGQTFSVDGISYVIKTANASTSSYTVWCNGTGSAVRGEVTIPSTVAYGDKTFTVTQYGGRTYATILHIPETVTKLAVDNNTSSWLLGDNLTDVYIPKSVTTMWDHFHMTYYNNKLKYIHVDEGNTKFMEIDGCLYSKSASGTPTKLWIIPHASWSTRNNAFAIPEGVTSIYNYLSNTRTTGAQAVNKNLKSLTLPSTFTDANVVPRIGGYCYSLEEYLMPTPSTAFSARDGVLLNATGTQVRSYPEARPDASYTAPEGVTSIPANAFNYVSKLETLVMPSTLTSMDANAISNCSNLTTLDLSQTQLTTLPANAVINCPNLTNIILPASMDIGELLENNAINGCPNIQFSIDPDDPNYVTEDGILFKKDAEGNKVTLIYCPASFTGDADGIYTVPATVTSISSNAFKSTKLKEIRFASSDNLTTIGSSAFYDSTTLSTIQIPRSVTSLGSKIFQACKVLTSVTFEEGTAITSIPTYCFDGCSKLTSFTIPESVTTIGGYAFQNSGVTSIVVPDHVTNINHAFYQAKALKSLHIGKSVSEIWGDDFYLSPITSLTFAEDCVLKRIGNATGSFAGIFLYLETLEIPKSVTTIGKISGSTVKKIVIPEGSKLVSLAPELGSTLTSIEGLENATQMTSIPAKAFQNYKKLTSLHFPSSITTIGNLAFDGCSSLTEITFGTSEAPSQIKTIGSGAFANCGITSFDIPSSVTTVGKEAFLNCNCLTEVNVGEVLTSIDPEAFKGCTTLTAYNVNENNTVYADIDGYLTDKAKTTLLAYPQGKSTGKGFTLMPPSLTSIGRYAFYNNDQVEKVILPANITSIGASAFLYDTSLRSLIFMGKELIDPDNICQGENDMAFDYPGISDAVTDNIMDDITICLTQDAYAQWTAAQAEGAGNKYYDYYSKFKNVVTTFTTSHSDSSDEQDEYMPVSDDEVSLLSTTSTATSFVLPATIEKNGKTYSVTMIADYAFENASANMKEVVVKAVPEYIGTLAFATNITRDGSGNVTQSRSTIEDIVFTAASPAKQLSSVEFGLTSEYKEFLDDINGNGTAQQIYVKRSAKDAYQETWSKYAPQIGTDLPLKKVNNTFATFSREFDVNINPKTTDKPKGENWNTSGNCPYIIAFTAGSYHKVEGEEGVVAHVRMTSINVGGSEDVNGTYIPANTGVLLMNTAGTQSVSEDFVYTIGEQDMNSYSGANLMQAVTEKQCNAQQSSGSGMNFYVAQGKLWQVPSAGIVMPLHTSYLTVEVPTGARVSFTFGEDENETTGISHITTSGSEELQDVDALIYNLIGQKVDKEYKGIVIVNGRKMFKK